MPFKDSIDLKEEQGINEIIEAFEKNNKITYDEWMIRKETELKLKDKLVNEAQKKIHVELISTLQNTIESKIDDAAKI